jgi:hypothetical protein
VSCCKYGDGPSGSGTTELVTESGLVFDPKQPQYFPTLLHIKVPSNKINSVGMPPNFIFLSAAIHKLSA